MSVQVSTRIEEAIKQQFDKVCELIGISPSNALSVFIKGVINYNGIPFSIRKTNQPIEINDGFGFYVCEYGYLHDYSNLKQKPDEAAQETVGPFDSVDEMMKSLNDE